MYLHQYQGYSGKKNTLYLISDTYLLYLHNRTIILYDIVKDLHCFLVQPGYGIGSIAFNKKKNLLLFTGYQESIKEG